MRVMGLDLGNKTLGVAISDTSKILASGYPTIRFKYKDFNAALEGLDQYLLKGDIEEIVLGLPKNMDGSLGEQANTSILFKGMLEEKYKIKVTLFDERLTTRIGLNNMILGNENRKTRTDSIDEAAAKVILQDYLDKLRRQ